MKVAVFSTKSYDREYLTAANQDGRHELVFFEPRLTAETCPLAAGFSAVCVFVHDRIEETVIRTLAGGGTRLIALRCAGFNNVDLKAAEAAGLTVVRVPAYSPYAVAEHTVGLMLTLNRKLHRAYQRVREGNFSLDGLMGFELREKTVGILGAGKIGACVAAILRGFGCRLAAYDPFPGQEIRSLNVELTGLEELFATSDILTLHCPLNHQTHHVINRESLDRMKDGIMLINTSRGALIDTLAVIDALKRGKIGYLGLDVYEEEEGIFFEDLSDQPIQDDTFARLLTFPNVLITSHQGFFTKTALSKIARTTLDNITEFETSGRCANRVAAETHVS